MNVRYFFIKTENPKIVRYDDAKMEVYQLDKGWVEQEAWFERIFLSDFSDYEEVSEKEANMFIAGMSAA